MAKLYSSDRQPDKRQGTLIVSIVAIVIVGVWAINLLFGLNPKLFGIDPNSLGDRGTFGDVFGASNSLFSGLALAGVVYAIVLQRSEIRIAREELARTKEIFDEQSKSLSLQNEQTKMQLFESTFFQMIALLTDITRNMDLESNTPARGPYTGKDVFPILVRDIGQKKYTYKVDNTGRSLRDRQKSFEEAYDDFYNSRREELGHYIRMIYRILRFVDLSDIEDKKFYTNILRAQFSDSELEILFYVCASEKAATRFKPLAERYSLFNNLNKDKLLFPELVDRYRSDSFA